MPGRIPARDPSPRRQHGARALHFRPCGARDAGSSRHARARVCGVALLFVIVDLVLVIACINLASLFFARAVARRNEIAVRLAVGAGRARILRQLLTESVLVSLVAGALRAVLALFALRAAVAFMPALPEGIRLVVPFRPDWRVLVYTLAFSTITGLLFGLAPALHAYRGALAAVLKDETNVTARFTRSRARTSLVVAQVALSLLLLIGAGLVLRTWKKCGPHDSALHRRTTSLRSVLDQTYDRSRSQQFFERIGESLAALPGVRSVSLVEGMPGGFMSRSRRSTGIEGYTPAPGESREIDANIVGPRFYSNMRVRDRSRPRFRAARSRWRALRRPDQRSIRASLPGRKRKRALGKHLIQG